MYSKNIIFDLGNVLVRLDTEACLQAFEDLGISLRSDVAKSAEAQRLMHGVGLGLITTAEFCDGVRHATGKEVTDNQIVAAADKMLGEIPDNRKELLLRLRGEGRRVFLLSNTIDMHWDYCVERLFPYKGYGVDDYFDGVFLSQRMHLEKPAPAIYKAVVQQTGVSPDETLYIDDLEENCRAARETVGWHVFQNKNFDDFLSLFDESKG